MKKLSVKHLIAAIAGISLVNGITFESAPDLTNVEVNFGTGVEARSSGGRSGGGSFRSSPSRSSGGSSSGSRSNSPSRPPSNGGYGGGSSYPSNRGGGTVIVPAPYSGGGYYGGRSYGYSTGFPGWIVGLVLMGCAGVALLIIYSMIKASGTGGGAGGGNTELSNNVVTVSKVQVALLAQAHEVQKTLSQVSAEADTETPEGLYQLMQECVLVLLRSPEDWSHVLASSETVKNLETAESRFNQISITERSKFSVETLTNVGGRINRRTDFKPDADEDPAAFIVVTLIVGTAHDKPLFDQVRDTGTLKMALQKLASIPPDYLMVFEVLWSPQDPTDSLTYDELLSEYTDMVQI